MSRLKLALVLLLALLLAGCAGGILASVRAGWAVGKPVVDDLVAQKVITADAGRLIKADFDDGIASAIKGEACLRNVSATDANKKVAQARCYFEVAQDGRTILARHNIKGDERLDRATAIIESVLAALEEYFRNVVTVPEAEARGESVVINRGAIAPEDPDVVLKRKLKAAKVQLDQLKH